MRNIVKIFFIIIFTGSNALNAQIENDRSFFWTDSVFNSLNDEQRAAQLLMIAVYPDYSETYKKDIQNKIQKYNPGGVLFMQGGIESQAEFTNRLQTSSNVPLFIAMDAEWGLGMRLKDGISYPFNMALGAVQNDSLIYEIGKEIGRQMKELGAHINFAPVVDVNSNPLNTVINYRSFGSNPQNVAARGSRFVKGLQSQGIIAVAKHFPGHGDTERDSHYSLPVVPHAKSRLDSVELYPFQTLIDSGAAGIMTAHVYMPALDSAGSLPVTLSPDALKRIVRDSMNFNGLVFSDAMNMKSVTEQMPSDKLYIQAIRAGNDVLEFVPDLEKAIQSIVVEMKNDTSFRQLVYIKCRKVILAKYITGLSVAQPVNTDGLTKRINTERAWALKEKAIEKSITLLRNKNALPLAGLDTLRIATVAIGSQAKTTFQDRLELYANVRHFQIGRNMTASELNKFYEEIKKFDIVLAGIHNIYLSPYTRSIRVETGNGLQKISTNKFGISEPVKETVEYLAQNTRCIFTHFGNAYAMDVFENIHQADGLIVTYQENDIAMSKSASLIFGGENADGKLPVDVNKYFRAGDGIETRFTSGFGWDHPLNQNVDSSYLNFQFDSLIYKSIREKAFPGCQVLVARNSKIILHKSYGYFTFDSLHQVENSDLYDLASLTKILASVPVMVKFVQEGKINLDEKLSKYWCPLWFNDKVDLTFREMLAHQAGFAPGIPFYRLTLNNDRWISDLPGKRHSKMVADSMFVKDRFERKVMREIRKSPLNETSYLYSDLPFVALPHIVKKISGNEFRNLTENRIYRPFGIQRMTFNPLSKFEKEEIAPTENDTIFRHQLVHGSVHDESAALLGGVSGNAGLFGNSLEVFKMMQLYLNKGILMGRIALNKTILEEFFERQYEDNRRGLIFDRPLLDNNSKGLLSSYPCYYCSDETFGHSAFTGCWAWADPKEMLVFVFLTNRIFPDRSNRNLISENVRSKLMNIIYQNIEH